MPTVNVTTPSDLEVQVTRTFNAPAKLVFDYNTKPELVQRWLLGPPGWSMPTCDIDLRVGGRYRYVWRSDTDGSEFGTGGEFREIVPGHRVVSTEAMDGFDGEALVTMTFAENGGRTTMTTTMKFASKAARDGAVATGMTDGMGMSYDRMEQVMAEQAAA